MGSEVQMVLWACGLLQHTGSLFGKLSQFPTEAARIRTCGICDGQSGNEAGFLRALQFSLPIIPPTAPHSSSLIAIRGRDNSPFSGLSNSGLGSTQPQQTRKSYRSTFTACIQLTAQQARLVSSDAQGKKGTYTFIYLSQSVDITEHSFLNSDTKITSNN
jgi:hypothetical protein